MFVKLCAILFVFLSSLMFSAQGQGVVEAKKEPSGIAKFMSLLKAKRCNIQKPMSSISSIKAMLEQPTADMSPALVSKVLTTLTCAKSKQTQHNHILTVIDYSRPSNTKRLWVFDINKNKMLFHTYVSHGIKSGTLLTDQFSNKNNSKASSLGVYKTDKAYYGRHGLSLKLAGLERGFNDRAYNRAIVMHSAWYMDEEFIKKYGRPGRSWGCPAIPENLKKPLINTIKDNALLVVYYPGEKWILHSKYLNCGRFSPKPSTDLMLTALHKPDNERAGILFVERNKNNKREESEPIVVMSADDYSTTFNQQVPLKRMLRCQINKQEYVALSNQEFEILADDTNNHTFDNIYFVRPEVRNIRGYYKTFMNVVNMGKIKNVVIHARELSKKQTQKSYTLTFDKRASVQLNTTHRFIRWLGL
ncbi:MAG: murein L,D-transpeptidase catalytic domain family protein [Legionellaceae bacterium]|nr:murein L,D-transpeptidase catalytic domain family protein [Legionellaceae bacterium]